MKILFLYLSITLLSSACGHGGSSPSPSSAAERVEIAGAGNLGIFDPAITRDPVSGRLWMSYSSVDSSIFYPASTYWAVSIRLAHSDDNGARWTDAGLVAPYVETLVGPMNTSHPTATIGPGSQGIWQSETSALIYDPGALPAERWKLVWFQYLNANLTSFFADHSWISLKTAATPLGLLTATPVKLFGGAGLQADGANSAAPVFSPIGGTPSIRLNTDLSSAPGGANLAELGLCVFAEPGLHATSNALYLTIFCADATTDPVTEYLLYFRCPSPCNTGAASSWDYLGRLLTPADALAATGNDHFQAPALATREGDSFLIVTPVDTTVDNRYNGCRVYELIDIDSNQLRRSAGQLVEASRVYGETGSHHGACAAYAGIDGGILLSQFEATSPTETFKIYKSQVNLP